MTMEDYLHYDEESFKTPNHGDIVDGIVVRVDPDEVLVDIGAKAEGVISSKELGMRGDLDSAGLEPGDQIKVYVLQPENEEGNVVLSLRRARAETTWLVAAEKQTDGTVTDILQLGEEVAVKVIKLDPEQTRISLSLRQLQQDPWERLVQSMPVGSIVEGQVTKTKKYGAFLQIMPGIEGLLHISELSWDHVERTEDVLKVGETVQVKVIGIDTARRRISLSLKQLSAPPASLAGARPDRRPDEYPEEDEE